MNILTVLIINASTLICVRHMGRPQDDLSSDDRVINLYSTESDDVVLSSSSDEDTTANMDHFRGSTIRTQQGRHATGRIPIPGYVGWKFIQQPNMK